MAWLVVDEFNREFIVKTYPIKVKEEIKIKCGEEEDYHGHFMPKEVGTGEYKWIWDFKQCFNKEWYIELPKGSIKKLIGRELTWEDKPVKVKEKEE